MKLVGLESFLRKGQTWRRLSSRERSLLLKALVLLPLVTLVLQLGGLKRTQAVLMRLPQPNLLVPTNAQVPLIISTVQMVQIAAQYSPWWTNCLKKSLVLWYLLRHQGVASQLQIGVRLEAGFQSHAWVEYQGRVIGESQDVRQLYTAFDRLNTELNRYSSSV